MPGPPDLPELPEEARRQLAAGNLNRFMIAKGWNQSELARRAARHMPSKEMSRDSVSKYCRARNLPGPVALSALARALGVTPEDILPAGRVVKAEHPPFSMQQISDGNFWLRVNQAVPMSVAVKIAALLRGSTDDPKAR